METSAQYYCIAASLLTLRSSLAFASFSTLVLNVVAVMFPPEDLEERFDGLLAVMSCCQQPKPYLYP